MPINHAFLIVLMCLAAVSLAGCREQPASTDLTTGNLPSGSVSWPGLVAPATKHVDARLKVLETAPIINKGVLFLGDSITEGAPLFAMYPNLVTANHGIGWDTTDGVLLRMGQITKNRPERLFLMIGTNDTNYTDDADHISGNIFKIVTQLNLALESTEIYVISILPREPRGNQIIEHVNAALKVGDVTHDYVYLDLAASMRSVTGVMKSGLSYDNLHLNVHGYAVWEKALRVCVWSGCPSGI